MKIDLGPNQSIVIKKEMSRINISAIVLEKKTTVIMELTEAVAFHAALGEEIRELRKK